MRIGIDLDNTVIRYDRVFREIAREHDLIPEEFRGDKQAVRDHIRTLPDGERCWTGLQAEVYGPRLGDAELFPGVDGVLSGWASQGHELFIVSHKTRYAAADTAQTCDLRVAALGWLRACNLVGVSTGPIDVDDVYFEDTRPAKCRRIAALGCDVFIDDLPEVFEEDSFPADVQRILFQSGVVDQVPEGVLVARSWKEVADAVV